MFIGSIASGEHRSGYRVLTVMFTLWQWFVSLSPLPPLSSPLSPLPSTPPVLRTVLLVCHGEHQSFMSLFSFSFPSPSPSPLLLVSFSPSSPSLLLLFSLSYVPTGRWPLCTIAACIANASTFTLLGTSLNLNLTYSTWIGLVLVNMQQGKEGEGR